MTDERSEKEDSLLLAYLHLDDVAFDDELTALRDKLAASAATIAAQAAEIERLTKRVQFLEDDDLQGMKIANKQAAELAALRSQLEQQRKRLEWAVEFHRGDVVITKPDDDHWYIQRHVDDAVEFVDGAFASFDEAIKAIPANWLAPHAEKGAEG